MKRLVTIALAAMLCAACGNTPKHTPGDTTTENATVCGPDAVAGDWTMPDPIDENGVMGIRLHSGGTAESINMATLVYTSWELLDESGKILLKGRSIGNGQTIEFEETAVISGQAESPTLTFDNGTVYTRTH